MDALVRLDMGEIEPVPEWPSEDCTLKSEYESFVLEVFDTAYTEAERRLNEEGQAGAHHASLEAQGRVKDAEGIELLGVGAGRLTVAGDLLTSDEYVLKIAKYTPTSIQEFQADGLAQNRMEAETWAALEHGPAEWFAPVTGVDAESRWLIQPRVDTETPLPLGDETRDVVYDQLRAEDWMPVELNATNLAIRDGGITIYDYGLPMRPRSWFDE